MNRLKECKNLDPYIHVYIKLLFIFTDNKCEPLLGTGTKLTGTLHCSAYFIAKALQIKRGATESCISIGSLHCSGACVKDNRKGFKNLWITSMFAREERGH